MRLIKIILFSIVIAEQSFAQKNISTIKLDKNIILHGTIETFVPLKHKYDTCDTGLGWKAICLIDGKIWFGNDVGMALPRNQLTKLTIIINKKEIQLDVSGMYNPVYENELKEEQLKIEKAEAGYLLYGMFSDGAGAYMAQWKIVKGTSIRMKISNDEKDFW